MSEPVENDDMPKNRSWIYLVAVFIGLVAIGAFTN